jgi:hypothetical protein
MLDIIGEFRAALAADPPEAESATYEVHEADDDDQPVYWGA